MLKTVNVNTAYPCLYSIPKFGPVLGVLIIQHDIIALIDYYTAAIARHLHHMAKFNSIVDIEIFTKRMHMVVCATYYVIFYAL